MAVTIRMRDGKFCLEVSDEIWTYEEHEDFKNALQFLINEKDRRRLNGDGDKIRR